MESLALRAFIHMGLSSLMTRQPNLALIAKLFFSAPLNLKPPYLFGLQTFFHFTRWTLFFGIGIPPKKISVEFINFLTHPNRHFHGLHYIIRNSMHILHICIKKLRLCIYNSIIYVYIYEEYSSYIGIRLRSFTPIHNFCSDS